MKILEKSDFLTRQAYQRQTLRIAYYSGATPKNRYVDRTLLKGRRKELCASIVRIKRLVHQIHGGNIIRISQIDYRQKGNVRLR